jgi:hypothetical protein
LALDLVWTNGATSNIPFWKLPTSLFRFVLVNIAANNSITGIILIGEAYLYN